MPALDVDAVMFVKQIPEITLEDGHFHVRYDVGQRARFEFVFSPSTFLKMRRMAGALVDQFHEGQGKIVTTIPRRKKESAEH